MFNTHPGNIAQIRAVVAAHGGCWIHGDGNLFAGDDEGTAASKFHQDFGNPSQTARGYRVKFTRNDMDNGNLPKTKEELDHRLQAAKHQDILSQSTIQETNRVKNIVVTDSDFVEPAGSIDYSKYTK